MKSAKSYDELSAFVFGAGVYEGVVPFLAKPFGWRPLLSLPVRLPSPAWWLVSAAALVAAVVLLCVIDTCKKRRFPE
ncbi:hypothetical protein [Actinomadura atramentaria]|uniref:hypothetical protein n=1 Tax=Actinomadura atramentaria TaxID=1990 RepID=UPI0003819E64|nr:hypothetical protein [Actinomadura atramentaria]